MILLQILPFKNIQTLKTQRFSVKFVRLILLLSSVIWLLTGCTRLINQLNTSEPATNTVAVAEPSDQVPIAPTRATLPTFTPIPPPTNAVVADTSTGTETQSASAQQETGGAASSDRPQLSEPVPTATIAPTETPLPVPTQTATTAPRTIGIIQTTLNVRSAPNIGAQLLGQIPRGAKFDILATSEDGQWLRLCCPVNNAEGWVSANFVTIDAQAAAPITEAEEPTVTAVEADVAAPSATSGLEPSGTVNGNQVNLRSGPGTEYETIGQVRLGETYALVERNAEGSWWRICCPVGDTTASWISGQLLSTQFPVGTDATVIPVAERPAAPAVADNQQAAALAAPAPGLPGSGGFSGQGNLNPLTGQPMPAGRENQRVLVVCINNDFAARPQFGTSQADVMYEYMMEGNFITRFSGVFYGEDPSHVGPVRSARLINQYMAALYNAGLVCSGASDQVRYVLKHSSPFPYLDTDLDDPSNTLYSDSIGTDYRTRMRTSIPKLRRWLSDWGVEQPAGIRGFTFGGTPAGGSPASTINIPYPTGVSSQSSYRYDPGSGRYLRFLGGVAHTDGNTGAQLAPENVIVQYVPHETTDIVEDSQGSLSLRINLFGSGRATVFRDGQAFEGTWRSDSQGDMPRFFAQDGSEIPLKAGKTWISVVPLAYGVSYQ